MFNHGAKARLFEMGMKNMKYKYDLGIYIPRHLSANHIKARLLIH